MNVLCYCFMLGAVVITYGLQIEFSASPKEGIRFPITEHLVLRCSLNASQNTWKNIKYVTSITVKKNNNIVASAVKFIVILDLSFEKQSKLKATGKVSKLTPKDNYLELVWTLPRQTEAGSYSCQMKAVNEFSDTVVITKTLQVDSFPATMNDILTHAQSKLQPMHTEVGYISCGKSSDWPMRKVGKADERFRRMVVKFSKAYDVVPNVFYGESYMDVKRRDNSRFSIRVINTSKTDFTVECVTWADTIINRAKLFWISLNGNEGS